MKYLLDSNTCIRFLSAHCMVDHVIGSAITVLDSR